MLLIGLISLLIHAVAVSINWARNQKATVASELSNLIKPELIKFVSIQDIRGSG